MMNITEEQYEVIKECLPQSAKELVLVIGRSKAFELFSLFGGVQVLFGQGKQTNRGSESLELIRLAIGQECFLSLQKHYGCERLYIPKCCAAKCKLKRLSIVSDFFSRIDRGISPLVAKIELSRFYETSTRMVEGAISEHYKSSNKKLVW